MKLINGVLKEGDTKKREGHLDKSGGIIGVKIINRADGIGEGAK